MRSLQEIDAEIAAVKARMAKRAEGLPVRDTPEYRAARFDYIVDGNRQGLDLYQNSLQNAMQQKLQRELTASENEKNRQNAMAIAKLGKEASTETDRINWVKNTSDAEATLEAVRKQAKEGLASPEDVKRAENAVNAQYALGVSKKWMEPVKSDTKKEPEPKPEFDPTVLRNEIQAVIDNDEATDEEIAAAYEKNKKLDSFSMQSKLDEKSRGNEKKKAKAAYDTASNALDEAIATGDPDKIDAAADDYEKHKDVEGYKGDKAEKARKESAKIRKNNAHRAKGRKVLKNVTYEDVQAADADKSTQGRVNKEGFEFKYKWLPNDTAAVTFDGVTYKIPRP